MYQIIVKQDFDAAHFLRGYQGKCEMLHGHRFQVVVRVAACETDNVGISCDFKVLKQHLHNVLSRFDHTCLNEVAPFDKINPSSENIAKVIYNEMEPLLTGNTVRLSSVEVWESPGSGVVYHPD